MDLNLKEKKKKNTIYFMWQLFQEAATYYKIVHFQKPECEEARKTKKNVFDFEPFSWTIQFF